MDDTSQEIAEKMHAMFQQKSPIERLKMGFSMNETSRHLVTRFISENQLIYSGADLRQELFMKFYGNDFDPDMQRKILQHLGPHSTKTLGEDPFRFDHIPNDEKNKEWWRRLEPIFRARLQREKPEDSKLLRVLSNRNGFYSWRDIKYSIELAIQNVKGGESILARTSEIEGSSDPDGIIDDMIGELRTVPYLLMKGFKNICYSRRDGLDFTAEFEGKGFHIESTYVHGPDFKSQEYYTSKFENNSSLYKPFYINKIRPDKLVRLFERTYSDKKEQVMRHHGTAQNSLIFMITDLEETYAPWLEHAKIQGVHPLLNLILSWDIPVVIFGCGSVYEPHPDSLEGVFGKLQPFEWSQYAHKNFS